jgi:hypothetical protein
MIVNVKTVVFDRLIDHSFAQIEMKAANLVRDYLWEMKNYLSMEARVSAA